MKIALKDLRQKILETLSAGFSREDAESIAEVLLYADMSGIQPMGVAKLTGTEPLQNIKAKHDVIIERDTKLSQLINAGANSAPLVSQQATDVVIKKTKEHGFAIVGVRNTFSSNLAQAFYVEKIAKQDLIGITMASSPAVTAPFDSIDPLFGSNPIGFAFPTDNEPLVFDMTTSAMAWYGLILAKSRGESLPDNTAIDSTGKITNDAASAMGGAMLPFDSSYKGSGLSLLVETLAGPLVNAAYCDINIDHEYGSLFMAIDPNLLVDVAEFKTHSSDLLQKIKSSRKKEGVTEIRLPGERARLARQEAERTGFLEIDSGVAKELGWL